jgi:transcriptional regulator with XRE-family HTH domain
MTTPTVETFAVVDVLGQRLRERRRELGLTLAEVAAAAEISVGHSSAIEKGNTLPSLPVLARLAHALGLTLADVLRASPGPRIAHGHVEAEQQAERLSPRGSTVQISYAWEPAGVTSAPPFPLTGDDVFVFVHEGAIEIEVNDDRHELAAGDSIHCHAPRAIAWTPAPGGAGTIWVERASRARDSDRHQER